MDASEWFRWATAFFLGALSTVLIEFGRGQFERRQRKSDRRDGFRREKMIELLTPVCELMEFIHRFYYPRAVEWWEFGDWPHDPESFSHLGQSQELEYENISVRTQTLSHLIADEQIERSVETLLSSARTVFGTDSHGEADAAYKAANDAYLSIARRIGDLQQSL